jgi:hypothetical protein
MWHAWGRGEVHAWFSRGVLRKIDCWDDLSVDGGIILNKIFQETGYQKCLRSVE